MGRFYCLFPLTLLFATLATLPAFTPPPLFHQSSSSAAVAKTASSSSLNLGPLTRPIAAAAATVIGAAAFRAVLNRPSRPYTETSVGEEYDAWTQDGILE